MDNKEELVELAKKNLEIAIKKKIFKFKKDLDYGIRWELYAERMRKTISSFISPEEVLHYAQSKVGFEHRNNTAHEGKFTSLYENQLYAEFPNFKSEIDKFSDIENSVPDSIYVHKGRPVSNILFYLTRIVLSCLTHINKVDCILEIGGGYGAPARLWMKNPIRQPKTYIIVDLPESLFFSNVFLMSHFSKEDVLYVTDNKKLSHDVLSRYKFILCPVKDMDSLSTLSIDLIINTGSLQEMSEGWVDYYMSWLDRQQCKYFYSLNYFAQPISYLAESVNLWSPRLSAKWESKLVRWNPAFVRMQTDRNYLELIAEKINNDHEKNTQIDLQYKSNKFITGEVFAEYMDEIRHTKDEKFMYFVLVKVFEGNDFWPKELLWICNTLISNGSEIYLRNKEKIDIIYGKLSEARELGIEGIRH